jgi:hypothetical protein
MADVTDIIQNSSCESTSVRTVMVVLGWHQRSVFHRLIVVEGEGEVLKGPVAGYVDVNQ